MRVEYTFTILGTPVGQGALKPVPRRDGTGPDGKSVWNWRGARLIHQNEKALKPWRNDVADAAIKARSTQPIIDRDIAVQLSVVFYFQRPQSAPRRITRHTKLPDADKLLRSLDALTGIVWIDDAQVDEVHCWKRYAGGALDPLGAAGTPRMVVRVQAQEEAHPKDATLFEQPDTQSAVKPERRKASKPARLEVGF